MASKRLAFPEILTPRLRLRQVGMHDLDALHTCFGDRSVMRYWGAPATSTLDETKRMATWLGKTSSPYDHYAWAIAERKTDRCLGTVMYHHREARHRRVEVAFVLASRYQGKGLATEALAAMIEYCATRLQVHRFEALIHPDNAPARRLAERLDFVCEGGPLADYWCVDDVYMPVMMYGRIGARR